MGNYIGMSALSVDDRIELYARQYRNGSTQGLGGMHCTPGRHCADVVVVQEEIKLIVEKVCQLFPSSSRDKCISTINTYVDMVISLVLQEFTPEQICQQLGFCAPNRNTKFNASVLNEVDSNNDPISRWCKSGTRNTDAFCILCNCTISCAQHGAAAVKRHAGMKKHIDAAARHRDKDGNLLPPKLVQGTLDFSNVSANTSLEHQVSKAETTFALSVVAKGIPFSWGDTATSIYHCMFPDSDIAKKFSCGRIKLARIVSDGLGPYFKGQVVTELCQPNVYFSIMIDETPKPELRVQQLDVLVRYFSSSQQEVVVEHVQSFDLGRATAEIIVGCIEEAIADLPKQGLVCFFSDGPNVMKSVRNKLQKHVAPSLIDIGNCNLHKVHNAFGRGLDAFGLDVEEVVRNIYYYFKGAVRAEALRECQDTLGISCHVFLRHVSNRWLTLQDSLCRVEEQFEALRTYFFKGNSSRQRPDTQSLHNKLVSAFSEKQLLAKVLFLKNCAQLFSGFQLLFQKQEPLLHILHVELIVLVQRVLSRFLRHEAFADKSAEQLKRLDVMDASLWKSRPEVGTDTEKSMLEWDSSEKKRFYLGARAFYLACAKDLLQKLPLDNRVLQSASLLNWQSTNVESEVRALKYLVSQLPQVIKHEEVSSAIDEWHMLKCDSNSDLLALGGERIDVRWGKIFELKSPGGQPKYPLLSRLVKCLLCLPHGNADCERGFSENKRFYENRYSLCIASINGLRQTKTYLRRYDGDATKVPLSTELLQSVRRSRARYTERTASAQQSESRKRLGDQDTGADVDEKRLRKNLEEKVTSSRALLKRAEDIISSGLRSKSLEQVEAGQTLLAEGNSALSQTLSQLEELSKKEEVKNLLDKVCSLLPDSLEKTCTDTVNTYYDELVELIVKGFTPEQVCQELGLCPSAKKAGVPPVASVSSKKATNLCDVCKVVVTFINDELLQKNKTVDDVKKLLGRVCIVVPDPMKQACAAAVNNYCDLIVHFIVMGLTPEAICEEFALCTSGEPVQSLDPATEDFACMLSHDNFKVSPGWLSHFKARHDIVAKVIPGKAAAVDLVTTSL
ncbi:hypothetical protein HPB51_007089 [Rhipicephalus microplus]|uniref:Saposin B-type domain-containing protein n=1 Tax=Rhipicephalus microplus TaxID=6941 RepID=A0A9J6DZ70_RHIMP|nr:hypothetical protein HPB51_007089 [Rhipicephalus microplus]